MKLIVTDRKIDTSFNEVVLTIDEFCDIHTHPYIATAGFDVVVVDLDSKIPSGYLSAMVGKFIIIPRIIEDISTDTIRLLSEIYKEKSSTLRFNWLKKKQGVKEIIDEMAETFQWESYY